MKLNELSDNKGARYKAKRLGRGIGSGKGKTSARGGKGQTARTGVAVRNFEGGQTPIYMRLPKRGFTSRNKEFFEILNVGDIQKLVDRGIFKAKDEISKDSLVEKGVFKKSSKEVKLLAKGELKVAVNLTVAKASKAAVEAVSKSGGKVNVLATSVAAE